MSKQGERRNKSPRRPRVSGVKTGPRKECFAVNEHKNAVEDKNFSANVFIGKVK